MLHVNSIALSADARALLEAHVAAVNQPVTGWRWVKAAVMATERRTLENRATGAAAALKAGTCTEVRAEHDTPPAVVEHEHGLLVLIPVTADQTLMLDISSVSEDPRWKLHSAGKLFHKTWQWLRIPGMDSVTGFRVDGPAIQPVNLPELHGTSLEQTLTEGMGWPGDDAIIPYGLDELTRLAKS